MSCNKIYNSCELFSACEPDKLGDLFKNVRTGMYQMVVETLKNRLIIAVTVMGADEVIFGDTLDFLNEDFTFKAHLISIVDGSNVPFVAPDGETYDCFIFKLKPVLQDV